MSKNKTTMKVKGGVLFLSYGTPVAANIGGQLYRTDTKFSSTTSRHVNEFVGKNAETKPQDFFYQMYDPRMPKTINH